MDITDLTATKFNQFLIHTLDTAIHRCNITTDDNNNTDYARRQSYNGGADATGINESLMTMSNSSDGDQFLVVYGINITSEEKLFMSNCVDQTTAGAGTAPARKEFVSKVDTTTNTGQYTRIDINNSDVGSFDTSSNLSALGSD